MTVTSMLRVLLCASALLVTACAPLPPELAEPDPQQVWIAQMLADADAAFAENRLMIPAGDNAYDRYRQILDIDPDNADARLGLKKVGRRYLSLAMESAHGGDLVAAERYAARARIADPGYEALDHMDHYIALLVEEQRQARAKEIRARASRKNEHWLDAAAVSQRSPALVVQLHALARDVRDMNTRLEIIARSDAEGRWIYQAMRDAVAGYRLRANLSIGREPRIILIDVQE